MVDSVLVKFAGEKAAEMVLKQFGQKVIERWTTNRANSFFVSFLDAVRRERKAGVVLTSLDAMLDEMTADEAKSETLFQAYRHVALSRSRDLGPRVIGLLTAELVLEGRTADDDEEGIFEVAEALSDHDLMLAAEFVTDAVAKADATSKSDKEAKYRRIGDRVRHLWADDTSDSNHISDAPRPQGPVNLNTEWGRWAAELERQGLLIQDVTTRSWEYREDGERHIDQDGVATQTQWWLEFGTTAMKLARLIERANLDGREQGEMDSDDQPGSAPLRDPKGVRP